MTIALLDELLEVAAETVSVEGDRVVIKHCYAERRVTPLNVYLQEADEQAAREIGDRLWANDQGSGPDQHFPGRLDVEELRRHAAPAVGVLRLRRSLLVDRLHVSPASRNATTTTSRWRPNHGSPSASMTCFRRSFGTSSAFRRRCATSFMEHHADLLTVEYWLDVQQEIRDGKLFHFAPYSEERRLSNTAPRL